MATPPAPAPASASASAPEAKGPELYERETLGLIVPRWIGLRLDGGAHLTLTWFGANRTQEELKEIKADLEALRAVIPGRTVRVKFGDWHVLGKPDDIKNGKGLEARRCAIIEPVDGPVNQAIQAFHKKWYHHEEGEAEERKDRTALHMTTGTKIDNSVPHAVLHMPAGKGRMSKEDISALDEVIIDGVFMK